ncbi:MAG TPA: hypothetical protein VKJ00_15010, partial [Thermoanaerobaculia bacterium]|nr:hypothetical protein [Thermoanaerobaculia bacterium]
MRHPAIPRRHTAPGRSEIAALAPTAAVILLLCALGKSSGQSTPSATPAAPAPAAPAAAPATGCTSCHVKTDAANGHESNVVRASCVDCHGGNGAAV